MDGYADHFDLKKDISFGSNVKKVTRNAADTKWLLEIEKKGKTETHEFDKVVFCHGYQTVANWPVYEGRELFKGSITHSQQYRSAEPFRGKRVVIVGLSDTASDIGPDIVPIAAKVYCSHRRGAMPMRRYRNGRPTDMAITWRRRQIANFMQQHFPRLARRVADMTMDVMVRRMFPDLDPAWGVTPFPSPLMVLPRVWEGALNMLYDGSLESLPGIRRFTGPKSIEFANGRVIDDVDAVILCTGYYADWGIAPFVETCMPPPLPKGKTYNGPPMRRLYMNMFPPAYADSCALLCHSTFGKVNGFSFSDVTSMAISNLFRGVEPLPSRADMNRQIDRHLAWVASRLAEDPSIDTSCVRQWEFQSWIHQAAGTGMPENLGWGWRGLLFWLRDPKLYNLMNHGVETAHAYRFFDTGKRRVWEGARDEIIRQNNMVDAMFPIKDDKLMD